MSENAGHLTDAWWAERAKRFLHPLQVQIIETFQRADHPLSVRDLSEVFSEVEPVKLDYHVGRLRQLGALEVVGGQCGVDFMDVRYRLLADQSGGAERARLAIQFGKNLVACRTRARALHKELAFYTSLSEEEISSLEEGEHEPRLGTVIKLAGALRVSVGELLGGIEWKPDDRGGGRFELPGMGDASA
jgi:DNA-binding XRE family transcriptional regulator